MIRLQLLPGEAGFPLINAMQRCAISHPVFGAADHTLCLKRLDIPRPEAGCPLRAAAETLVGPSPLRVLHHSQRGREVPVQASGENLSRGDARDVRDQIFRVRRAEPDVVRKQRRAAHVVVPVHRVDAEQQGDTRRALAFHHGDPVVVVHAHPVQGAIVARVAATTRKNRAKPEGPRFFRGRPHALGHGHLADLRGQAHALEDALDPQVR